MIVILELRNSSITDALVSTLMNCFVGSPQCPPFKIILWLMHRIYLRIQHVLNISQFILKNFRCIFLSLLAGCGICWRVSHSQCFSNINFWRNFEENENNKVMYFFTIWRLLKWKTLFKFMKKQIYRYLRS